MSQFTTPDGLNIFFREWKIDNPKAVVILVHGGAEHSGRYEYIAKKLNAAGYSAFAPDHRSHGKSGGKYRFDVDDTNLFVDDLKILWDKVAQEYPDKPVFMVGHSMGGLIASMFTLRYQDKMKGLVTSGAFLLPIVSANKFTVALVKIIAKFAPKLLVVPKLDAKDVSRDPAIVVDYDSDPLNYRGMTRAGFGADMLKKGANVLENAPKITIPTLILHGGSDPIVPTDASEQLYANISSQDKTLKIYPELYHEIFNEPEKDEVIADVVGWLDERV